MNRHRAGSDGAGRILLASLVLVFYTFLGYPVAVAIAARVRPRPLRGRGGFEPTISFIIAAFNEEDVILDKLANVRRLGFSDDRLEIIVVADGSDDRTPELASGVPGVKVLHQPERAGKLAALTHAASVATGDIFVLSDANNMYAEGSLELLAAPFADPEVGVVTGRKMITADGSRQLDDAEGLYWRYESKIKEWETTVGSVTAVAGEILAFRREAFLTPQSFALTEDFLQAMLAAAEGWRIVYVPDAVSHERASATVEDEAVRRSRIVAGRWQALSSLLPTLVVRRPVFAFQVISHKGLRPFVPFMLVSAMISNAFARQRWARFVAFGQIVFYGLALLGRPQDSQRKRKAFFLPYYFCRMNIATLRGAAEAMKMTGSSSRPYWKKVDRG